MESNILSKAVMIGLCALTFTSCDRNNSAERAGENVDRAVENMGDKIENSAENAGDRAKAAGDRIEDKTD